MCDIEKRVSEAVDVFELLGFISGGGEGEGED